jgi:PBP1b-binding outer membrane lipoprotein LpoB
MKKYICILAGAALLVACEQKTETVAPASSPAASPEETTSTTTTTTTTTETPTPTPESSAPNGTVLNPETTPSP